MHHQLNNGASCSMERSQSIRSRDHHQQQQDHSVVTNNNSSSSTTASHNGGRRHSNNISSNTSINNDGLDLSPSSGNGKYSNMNTISTIIVNSSECTGNSAGDTNIHISVGDNTDGDGVYHTKTTTTYDAATAAVAVASTTIELVTSDRLTPLHCIQRHFDGGSQTIVCRTNAIKKSIRDVLWHHVPLVMWPAMDISALINAQVRMTPIEQAPAKPNELLVASESNLFSRKAESFEIIL